MYKTKVPQGCLDNGFSWDDFFLKSYSKEKSINHEEVYNNAKLILKENDYLFTLVLKVFLDKLLKDCVISSPKILELGAATGFLSRMLLARYKGKSTLVDNNENSFKAFIDKGYNDENIKYLKLNIFELNLDKDFDIVCSFGLIEHFKEKKQVIDTHEKFLKENGIMVIIVPMDTKLSRVFFELHPELNLGYRELLNRNDLLSIFKGTDLCILKLEYSFGYVYDFIGVVCSKNNNEGKVYAK